MILYVNMLQNLYEKKVGSMKWHQGLRIDRCGLTKDDINFKLH